MGTYADEIFESLKKEKYSDRVFNQINQELSQKQQNNSQTVQRPNSDLHRTNREKQKEYNRLMSLDINAAKQKYDDSEKKLEALQNELNFATSPEFTIKRRMTAGPLRSEANITGDIETAKEQSKQYYKDYYDAKQLQTVEKANALKNNPDFEQYSKRGLSQKEPRSTDTKRGFWESFISDYDVVSDNKDRQNAFMTDDERNTYGYIYAKQGEKAAQDYLNALSETLNLRRANQTFQKLKGNTSGELAFGVASGLDQFSNGVGQWFSEDRLPTTATQFISSKAREDLENAGIKIGDYSLGQVGYDLITTTSNMAPSILLSGLITAATGGAGAPVASAIGSATLGMSAGGNAVNEALAQGYSPKQAKSYGLMVGASEGALSYLLGGISKLGGKLTNNAVQQAVGKIDNVIGNVVTDIGIKVGGEFTEEYLQEILTPVFKNICFDEKNEVKPFSEEALYSGIMGALSAGLLEGPSVVFNTIADSKAAKQQSVQQEQIENQKSIAEYNNKAQYSIQTDSNGKKYVNVDTDQHIFEGVEPKEYHKIARKYILENFRGKIIGENESRAFVNKRSAEEYAYPANKRQESDIKSAKMKSSTELDNLMSTSQFVEHTDDDGRHPDATGGWDWYSVDFVVDGQPFNGTISVKNTDNGRVFYDMTKIRSLNDRKSDLSGKPLHVASVDKTSINTTISQDTNGVNTSIRENTGNITENRKIRVPESELKVMKAIAKNHKIPFEIKDLGVDAKGSPIEGKYENGVIYVSPYAKNPSLVIFKHELTHYLEKDTYRYGQLLNVVKSYYDEMGETLGTDYAAEIRKIYDNYRARGKTLEDGEAERELVANFAGKYLFTDEKAIQYLAGKKPSIARSILNWIREQIAAIKGDVESELLIKAERMYVNALKAADKRAGIEGKAKYSTQYSLGYTTDNKPVVVVEDDILKGVPKNKWIETVKNTISEKFADGIPVSGRLIKVNSVTRNEYANSRNTRYLRATDGSVYADKFKSANNLDEIVLASTNYINEDLKHQRNDSFKEFARGDVLIRVGDNDYSAKVIVGFTGGKEMVLYDIINFTPTEFSIKKERTHQGYAQAGSPRKDVSSGNTTVPQKAQSVNTSISKNAENDTVGAKYSLSESSQNNKKITANMDENERAEVLRNSTVNLSVYDGNNEDLNAKNVILLKSSYNSQAGKILKSLGEKFGVFKSYSNENVSLDFDYPRVSLNESVHKQGNISTDFYDFAKMLYVFDDVVKNAVPIEVHTDKYKGTTRENPNLKYDYVLLSAFQDGDYIIPVEFHVKEMNEGATPNNKLYVSVTLGKIKIENERIKVETSDPNGRTSTLPTTFSNISIADLVKKINPEYGNFYKYIPSVLLDEKQQLSKNTAVKDENYRLKVMRGEDVSDLLREAAAEKGYTTDDNWKMDHKAPNSNDGYSNSMDKIDKSYGSDGSIYSSQAVYYYGEGREYDRKSISVIKSARNNPDKMIKIYRAVPTTVKDTRMRNGDWVAITKEYAEEHGGRVLDNDFRIIENTVPAKYLYSNGDSINEWGYDNGNQNEVYQNTKNNVKTVEVTYDDNGNIIPLSKRFDSAKSDPRYFLSDDYDNAVEQYGAIPPGENPARDVKVPKQMNDNTKVRRTVRTAMEASGTPGELVDRLKVDIANDVYDYKVVSDKSAVSSAKDRLDKWGLEKCYQYWKSLVNEDRKISKNDMALAEQMYIEAAHNGDFKVTQELMVDIAEEATRAGQNAQSIRLLKNLTPEGRIYKIDKLVYRIQKEIDRKTNGKAKTIEVDENLKKRMLNAKSQEEMDAIEHMVHKNIAKQMPEPTKMEKAVRKWNEWRYLAMLGNPRTHIRNIFGNALFAPMVNGKNAIGIALERTLSKDNRTKARLTAKDKATIEFAKSDFDTVNAEESKSSKNKYNESLNGLDVEEKVFKNKALEWARKTNSNLLEWEDTTAKRKRYAKSFAQFIKARGWDYQNLTDSQLDSARNYAMREAKRATFQDTSEVANALNKFSHQNIATEVLVEGLLPFKKTPINILKRGVEYSPFGIAKGITELAWDVKKGNMNASQAIDTLSCGLSGTAMMMVGVLLSSLGVLTSTSDDDKEGEFDKLSGNQEYALQFFGKSYTIDWIAPLSMPLFIGAEIENAVERGDADNGAGIGRVLDALTGISDPMFNLSMLQGINSSIKTVRYSDNPTVDLAANTVSGYLGQGIPTILGQTARTVDTTRRNSYYTPKDSAAGKLIDKTIKKTAAKIPGVSMLLEPYIDKWGNEQVADNWVLNAFENFASPGYYSENTNDSVTEEMARLYKATSDTGVVPHSAKSSLSTGGNTYRLSEKEYTQYQKTLGKASHEQLQKLINSTAYSNMSNEEKAVAVGKMYRYAEESAKVEFYKGRGIDFDDTPTIKKFNEAEESGVDLYDYLYAYVSVKDMESDKNASGETIRGSLKRKQISCMVNQLGIPAKTANKIYDLMH